MISNFQIITNYRDNESYRNEFFKFISKVFPGISFKEWYEKGFWTNDYVPFSIIQSDEIVSGLCAAFMDVIINDKQYKGIQIGAVGTLPELRNQGLSRRLMELLIDKYSSEVDLFFLFANDSVMDFYPKFGFQKMDEYIYTSELTNSGTDYAARKLNMDNKEDYNLIIDFVQNRQPITKILGADNYGYITMWHLLNHHRENIFYLAEEDVIIIEEEKDSTIHIFELFNKMPIELETLLPRITSSERIAEAKFYFPPDQLKYEYETSVKEETGLFVLSSVEIGNDPFRFPTTAKT